ncbi:flagellar biosynthesis anti-sigma factor FlgM [Allosphingosinicella deserti]|uniref:Negative regulator of flagellin synthesis n=1 Tax=Allosphingosinicella deserti TaxID=2116704 RepID=A0A2P7QNW7_9SPHN|nr:flagellar biosynthesis anti-sigma factor FlgM [Sphingomonas deserti]PSJ39663.1 flagellar biosynthesis anti-sigma factor FlgM [Sphingomonas deserti]
MIDGIGKTGGGGRPELVRSSVERSEASAKAGDALSQDAIATPSTLISEMAGSGAPVDSGRVAAIRTAIAEGRYPVDPTRIAAAMIALDLPARDEA